MNGVPKKTHTKKNNKKTKQNKQTKTTTKTNGISRHLMFF